jgi:hypothetical protein
MTARQFAELLALAALWGASFLFMRVAVPEFGPVMVTEIRVLLASLALAPLLWMSGHWRALRAHAGPLVVVGVVNSALPFALYSYALLWISTGLAAIFNATGSNRDEGICLPGNGVFRFNGSTIASARPVASTAAEKSPPIIPFAGTSPRRVAPEICRNDSQLARKNVLFRPS